MPASSRPRGCGHDAPSRLSLIARRARLREAAAWLAERPAHTMLVAGGTDLLPNMKRRQQSPGDPRRAARRRRAAPSVHTGRGVTIGRRSHALRISSRDPRIRQSCPGLWQAAAQVATPHLRNMGTHRRQPLPRHALQLLRPELRMAQGDRLLPEEGRRRRAGSPRPARRCLAVSSTDTAPMLQALGARVTLVSGRPSASRRSPTSFANDGIHYLTRRPDEILTAIAIPASTGWRSCYWKLRRRGSFDFPAAAGRRRGAASTATAASTRRASCSAPSRRGRSKRIARRRCSRAAALTDEAIAARRGRGDEAGQADGQHRLRAGVAQEDGADARRQRAAGTARRRHEGATPAVGQAGVAVLPSGDVVSARSDPAGAARLVRQVLARSGPPRPRASG